jgi:nucleoside-diphosphate-sugar epimerase
MKKIIVITGSSGFIGSTLYKQLISKKYNKKYEFVLIDRRDNPYGDKYVDGTKFIKVDINSGLPDLYNVDSVIHLAALPSVRDSNSRTTNVINDNILATYNILKKCMESWKPKRLIIASSSSVYDGRHNSPNNETYPDNIRPLSPYAQTKLSVEEAVNMYINNGLLKDIDIAVLRIFTNYGPRQRDELSIRAIIDSCLNDKPFILMGDGKQRRDFIYVEDTCSAIESFISSWKEIDIKNPIYNVGTGNNHSILEVIEKVSRILDKPILIKYDKPTIYDTQYTHADIDKIKRCTGWYPKVDFDTGLRNQIEWQKKQKIK